MKVGDIVKNDPYRLSSNKVTFEPYQGVEGEILAITTGSGKSKLALRITKGYATQKWTYHVWDFSKPSFTRIGDYQMQHRDGQSYSNGDTILVFNDAFRVIEHATSHKTTDTGKALVSISKIKPHILLCMLS